ncbi:alpha/beta hydrolase family protein [Deinococcus radiophilus]|uniref:alpha/beta hydrolase family protein n=1 Tax=Deinococcus radiophilus TaxID=32062 RepID=UPI001E550199|nr:hypothetical protein [Deinococcus radiophilus]UFA50481.1 hypothetical protein LMT64_00750 [Deinococcus radiophilus]
MPPNVYRTTERYLAYQDAFARSGFVTFNPDLRRDPRVNGERLGIWGHSMGGFLALRAMTIRLTQASRPG